MEAEQVEQRGEHLRIKRRTRAKSANELDDATSKEVFNKLTAYNSNSPHPTNYFPSTCSPFHSVQH